MTAVSQQPDDALAILKQIEGRLTRIEDRLTDIETRLGALEVAVANLQGRVSQLPTSWQMLTAIVATVFTVTATTAGVLFAALNYAKTL
jgi:predicted nuclease with TOPRIM domain